ncbi:hypothetical protein ABZP36_014544 [Zizania latifolia]
MMVLVQHYNCINKFSSNLNPFSFSAENSLLNLELSLWMGRPLVDSSAKGVSSSLCLCHSTCEKAGFERSSCACSEDGNFEAGIAFGQDDLVVNKNEIATAIADVTHVYSDDDDDEGTDSDEDSDEIEDPLSLESDSAYDVVDIDTELVTSPTFPSCNESESSIGNSDDGNSSTNVTPVLASAMKGSRAKRGIVTRLSVSWAPDVYDPPVTSGSHTVRGHQRSSWKSHYKYKSTKSSSSHGSKKDKKHTRYSSSSSYKRDRKPSHRSANDGGESGGSSSSNRKTENVAAHYRKVYTCSSGSRTDTAVPQFSKLSPLVPSEIAPFAEVVPVLKTVEPIKRSSSCCKEQPLSILSRQFVAAKYKGMFSFWSQNQLAS